MAWFWDHYAPDRSVRTRPDASPLRAASLAGLPPAVILTAEHDVLRDEGEAYARRLTEHGVRVEHKRFDGQMHGFFMMVGLLPGCAAGLDFVGRAIDRAARRARRRRSRRPTRSRFRRDRRRRRLRRSVRPAPPARDGPERARARAGGRYRRHLVLEPLPRRALRHRVGRLLVLLLGGARAGMGMERAVSDGARDPALPEPRRRPLRPAPGYPGEHSRRRGALRRIERALAGGERGRGAILGEVLRDGVRMPVVGEPPAPTTASTSSRATGTTRRAGRRTGSGSPASASA